MTPPLPCLCIIVPCYNEEAVLPTTAPLFLEELELLQSKGLIDPQSRICFVDDGSSDKTWELVAALSGENPAFTGISLSKNRGHQNALLAGLMDCRGACDIAISIDADGQDDISVMEDMVAAYLDGCDVVYGVRSSRDTDSFFKRTTARGFYSFMRKMGVECVYDHADYRLLSARVLDELARYEEVHLFLRGMVPLVGFKSTVVEYERRERMGGKSHYPLSKMAGLAVDGVTSLSVRPIRIVTAAGCITALVGLVGILWALVGWMLGNTVSGWASLAVIVCFFGGVQMLSLGIIGEYVGKTYIEAKHRPRFAIEKRTDSAQ